MAGVEANDLGPLREAVKGEVIAPGDAGYEEARTIWNTIIDRNPAAVVRPRYAADVATAIEFARQRVVPRMPALSIKGVE